eukprot:symbB.v1.2.006351.t1/scaffold374.1/size218025/12
MRQELPEDWEVLGIGPEGHVEPWPVQLFDAAVLHSDGAVLRSEELNLTAAELQWRSRILAMHIDSAFQRISSEGAEFVAVCMPRGVALVVALLGVWRAGKAYVPLEPSFPLQRLRFMLEDSQAQLIITSSVEFMSKTPQIRLLTNGELEDANLPQSEDLEELPKAL